MTRQADPVDPVCTTRCDSLTLEHACWGMGHTLEDMGEVSEEMPLRDTGMTAVTVNPGRAMATGRASWRLAAALGTFSSESQCFCHSGCLWTVHDSERSSSFHFNILK